ncbi:hypothetical protein JCM10207_001948 [Rhodosporidiobolus poonsookiae]
MPLRLPPKPKKGKSKQLHIDYASPDTARATAPSDWQLDDWVQEGTRQEEQGERYIIGAKAARHCFNAITCYRLAANLDPSSFDARYNAARALQNLATEHLAPPACLEALAQAIEGYREALAVLSEGGGGTARIDALFNSAQANVALYEMLDEGVAAVEGAAERAMQPAAEARSLFAQVEKLQRVEMDKIFGADGPEMDDGDDSTVDETASEAGGSATEVQAVETTIVTPQLVLDTLLESIALDVALYSSSDNPVEQAALRDSALSTFSRASALRPLIPRSAAPAQPDDVDYELSLAQASILTTCSPSPEEATAFLQSALSSSPSPRVELLSAYADHLVDSLSLSQPLLSLLPVLEQALQIYQQAAALLSSRLSPPKHTPPHHLPSLLSANLAAQAQVHLVASTLSARDPSAAPSAPAHLQQAHELLLSALSAAKSGLALAVSASSPAGALKPALALVRAPASTEPRTDWRTLSAVRGALFALVRARLRLEPSEEGWSGETAQVWALWRAVGLNRSGGEKGSEEEKRLRKVEVEWWVGEIEEDKVSEAMSAEDREREKQWWIGLPQ